MGATMSVADVTARIYQLRDRVDDLVNENVNINTANVERYLSLNNTQAVYYAQKVIEHLNGEKARYIERYKDSIAQVNEFILILNNITDVFAVAKAIQTQIDYGYALIAQLKAFRDNVLRNLRNDAKEALAELRSLITTIEANTYCPAHLELYKKFNEPLNAYGKLAVVIGSEQCELEFKPQASRYLRTIIHEHNPELQQLDYLIKTLSQKKLLLDNLHTLTADKINNMYAKNKGLIAKKRNIKPNLIEGQKKVQSKKEYFDMLQNFIDNVDDVSASLIVAACFKNNFIIAKRFDKDTQERVEFSEFNNSTIKSYRYYLRKWVDQLSYYLGGSMLQQGEK